ncbi:alpha/beta fold hydrolase [Protofrankia sp. BMG5.30]|uniref:alpha/beta fold hydrolase n=1 Tax=Protofrankia sp. BMG5.30 TaxID=1834514 RepID=UPI000978370E|nr:alpha/beta fold hydrolase [Protofrankia sp. BMG5.30]ONH32328.1 alpha/beta hydrolase [Protofrankia sp. BMG5.30]
MVNAKWGIAAVTGGAVSAAVLRRRLSQAAVRNQEPPQLPAPRYRAGSGSPLLLLHGVGGTWPAWDPVLPLLEPHHDVLAPTLLGHGGGEPLPPGVPVTLDVLVDGVEAELDRAGWDRVHVVGNSLGGWIAIELARRGRARSLVLFSPAGAWTSQCRIAAVALGIRLSVATLARYSAYADLIAGNPLLRHLLLATQVAHPERVDPQAVALTIRASAHAPAVDPLLRTLPHAHLQPLPADHDYPIRVVWAQPDRVIPFEYFGVPMLERLPGAELIQQPGIGHVPMYDEPATVARQILEIAASVDQTRPETASADQTRPQAEPKGAAL